MGRSGEVGVGWGGPGMGMGRRAIIDPLGDEDDQEDLGVGRGWGCVVGGSWGVSSVALSAGHGAPGHGGSQRREEPRVALPLTGSVDTPAQEVSRTLSSKEHTHARTRTRTRRERGDLHTPNLRP